MRGLARSPVPACFQRGTARAVPPAASGAPDGPRAAQRLHTCRRRPADAPRGRLLVLAAVADPHERRQAPPQMPPTIPVPGPAAWHGRDMARHPERWVYRLTADDVQQLGEISAVRRGEGRLSFSRKPAGRCVPREAQSRGPLRRRPPAEAPGAGPGHREAGGGGAQGTRPRTRPGSGTPRASVTWRHSPTCPAPAGPAGRGRRPYPRGPRPRRRLLPRQARPPPSPPNPHCQHLSSPGTPRPPGRPAGASRSTPGASRAPPPRTGSSGSPSATPSRRTRRATSWHEAPGARICAPHPPSHPRSHTKRK